MPPPRIPGREATLKKVLLFSILLVAGLLLSQWLPALAGEAYGPLSDGLRILTMVALAFLMIHVGYEFEIDKSRLRSYGWDYVVAFTAASFPWVFVTLYFQAALLPEGAAWGWEAWKKTLLAARFAAPTSAGVLFSMLAAAGLSATWLFGKARVLAIFDDLDTVLLMIPLKMLMIGLAWQLGAVFAIIAVQLWIAYRWLHHLRIPVGWPWVLAYSAALAALSEVLHHLSLLVDESVPVHIEVLLPAFVLGCVMARRAGADPHRDDAREGHQEGPESASEQRVSTAVSAVFMVLVGLNMPSLLGGGTRGPEGTGAGTGSAAPSLGWGAIALHVLAVTVLSNLGKMFPALCSRREAHWRERLALAVGMWPRGEVGAGVLVVSLGYGIGGDVLTVAMLSLALNLLLTGVFIWIVKRLVAGIPRG
jgi:Kef-type K+ transport system membrane component KefB